MANLNTGNARLHKGDFVRLVEKVTVYRDLEPGLMIYHYKQYDEGVVQKRHSLMIDEDGANVEMVGYDVLMDDGTCSYFYAYELEKVGPPPILENK